MCVRHSARCRPTAMDSLNTVLVSGAPRPVTSVQVERSAVEVKPSAQAQRSGWGWGWGWGRDVTWPPKAFCLDWMSQGSQARETEGSKEGVDGECPFLFLVAQVAICPISPSSADSLFSTGTQAHAHTRHTAQCVCSSFQGRLMQGRSGLAFPISPAASGAAALLPLASAICSHWNRRKQTSRGEEKCGAQTNRAKLLCRVGMQPSTCELLPGTKSPQRMVAIVLDCVGWY